MPYTITVIRHLAFEDLGAFGPVFHRAGHIVRYLDAGVDDLNGANGEDTALLVVLGGPIGAYEEDRYPFLTEEIRLIEERLAAGRPIIGICLGSQLMARALGTRVYPGPVKEIGFKPLTLTPEGSSSALRAFDGNPVLHWHGDTFDLPEGAVRLASTDVCLNQAFSVGTNALATQFHPEAGGHGFERWLIGHTAELTQAKIDVPALRRENAEISEKLAAQADAFLIDWLKGADLV